MYGHKTVNQVEDQLDQWEIDDKVYTTEEVKKLMALMPDFFWTIFLYEGNSPFDFDGNGFYIKFSDAQ